MQPATPEVIWAILQETVQLQKENAQQIKELQKTVGEWANNHEIDYEPSFYDCLNLENQKYFGEWFKTSIEQSIVFKKGDVKRKYNIQLINDNSVGLLDYVFNNCGITELTNKAQTYREDYPEYKTHRIYLGAIVRDLTQELEQECINEGIAVIKQVGDAVVINDTNLKVF